VKVKKPEKYANGKLDSLIWGGIHLGYEGTVGTYWIFVPSISRVFVSRNVTFIEKLYRPISSEKWNETEVGVNEGEEGSDYDDTSEPDTSEQLHTTEELECSSPIARDRPRR